MDRYNTKPQSRASSRVTAPDISTKDQNNDYYSQGARSQIGSRFSQARSQRSSITRAGNQIVGSEQDQMMRSKMPRILQADDRTKFIQAIKSKNYDQDELKNMTMTVRSKLQDMLKVQQDDEYLRQMNLPQLPKNHYTGPKIVNHSLKAGDNIFVITNDSHSRHTNNGFQRNALGGYYAH
eukprot:403339126